MLSNEELIETNGRDNQGWVLLGRLAVWSYVVNPVTGPLTLAAKAFI
ncbi:hypothetical protein [Sphingobacterium thalpophilum]|nr:hypothetical protein [Sphingobacterium thalpophilum]